MLHVAAISPVSSIARLNPDSEVWMGARAPRAVFRALARKASAPKGSKRSP